jgi:hypothetical protein
MAKLLGQILVEFTKVTMAPCCWIELKLIAISPWQQEKLGRFTE